MTSIERDSSWFTLASGKHFTPFAPRVEDIDIEDIALALSHICRFSGHTSVFYSVAEHSVHCSEVVPAVSSFAALMHDTTEAYVGDMIRPIKKYLENYQDMELGVWKVLCAKFRLPLDLPPIVKWADNAVLKAEARDLLLPLGTEKFEFMKVSPPVGLHIWNQTLGIVPWSPEQARVKFLEKFHSLYNG